MSKLPPNLRALLAAVLGALSGYAAAELGDAPVPVTECPECPECPPVPASAPIPQAAVEIAPGTAPVDPPGVEAVAAPVAAP